MKKKKTLLLMTLSLVSAFTCACAFGCSSNHDDEVLKGNYQDTADVENPPADEWVLRSISLSTFEVTTAYKFGQDFDTSKKPVVTANYATVESIIAYEETKLLEDALVAPLVTKAETVTDFTVDYGQYNKYAVGTYNIYVSYTHAGVTRSASYTVTVASDDPAIGGITAYTEGFKNTYYIENEDGVNVSLDGLYFLNVDADLTVDYDNPIPAATEENPDGYTLTYYKNGTVIDSLDGLQKGDYTIMATYKNASAFVVVSVLDPVASIEVKPEVEGAKFEQVQSVTDELTSTWVFTVTYVSGLTKEVKKGDEGVAVGGIVTVTAGARETKVSYTEDNETVSVSVPYTVTAAEGLTEETHSMSISALANVNGNIQDSDMTGDNAFINPLGKFRHRTGNNSSFVDFNGEALTVTTNGFGTLAIGVRSTGAAQTSGLYLASEDGKYIPGIFDLSLGISEVESDNGKAYLVPDAITTGYKTITFILPQAGTYKLGALAVGSLGVTQAYVRMDSLVLTDVFNDNVDRVSYEFEINTDNVKKDYIAGQTKADLSKEGLTAVLHELHTKEPDKNADTPISADKLSIDLTAGDMSKLNTTGTVTVTYTDESGKEYKATYPITIKSPVTGVNSVALTKETVLYNLESATAETVTISTEDIVIHKNSATGDAITLGEGDSVTYKLYDKDGKELTGLGAVLGKNTIKATVVLKNTEAAVEGTTTFEAQIDIEVEAWVDPGATTQSKTITYTADGDPAADSIVKANKNDKVVTVTANKLNTLTNNNPTKFGCDYALHCQKSNGSIITIMINGSIDESVSITIEFFHTSGSPAQREIAIYKDAYSEEATPIKVSDKVDNAKVYTVVLDNLSDGTYVITSGNDQNNAATTVYVKSVTVKYDYESKGDEVDYTFDIDTKAVKKDYIAGETQLSKAGLTATLVENHSVDTDKNTTHNITADDLTIEVTSGDLTKLNTTAIVTVTYTYEGTPYTKNYQINVKSPVTGVNSVALTKETASYNLASADAETVEISNTDIVLHKNSATGDVINLGEGESVTYKLYKGEEELESWTVGVGKYTIKATIVLNNTEAAVAGTTTFTAEIPVSVGEYVAPGTKTAYSVLYKFDGAGNIGTPTWEDNVDGSVANNVAIKITTDTNKVEAKSCDGIDFIGYSQVNASNKNITVKLAEGVASAKITVYFRNSSGKSSVRTLTIYNGSDSVASWRAGTAEGTTSDAAGTDVTALKNVSIEADTEYTIKGDNSLYVYGIAISYEA